MARPSITQPSLPPACPLTLGIEVEFYAAVKISTFILSAFEGRLPNLFCSKLRQLFLYGPENRRSAFRAVIDTEYHTEAERFVDYKFWNVMTNATTKDEDSRRFCGREVQPIEIISPPYWAHSRNWQFDIQRIFPSRFNNYNPMSLDDSPVFYELNKSTSIHVHIGNGLTPGSCFPFETVRNLAMISLVYEEDIGRMLDAQPCPLPNMVSTCDHSEEPQALSSTRNSYFQPPCLPPESSTRVMARHLFNTCHDIPSVIQAMSPLSVNQEITSQRPFYYMLNFKPLLDSLEVPLPDFELSNRPVYWNGHLISQYHPRPKLPPKKSTDRKRKLPTIEFRQPVGTTDPDTMTHWFKFLVALVELAGQLSAEEVIEFLGLEDIGIEYLPATDEYMSSQHAIRDPRASEVTQDMPGNPYRILFPEPLPAKAQPIGSLCRLLEALRRKDIEADLEAQDHWFRKNW